jgi:hypothetical protein
MTTHDESQPQQKTNPYAKNTYRVLNEPFKLFGILDWKYALVAAVPAVFFGLFSNSKIVGIVVYALLAWQAWRIQEEDPNLPLVIWATIFDKRHVEAFRREKKGTRQ